MHVDIEPFEIDYSIECICSAWMDSDGTPWLTSAIKDDGLYQHLTTPVKGYEKKCKFHEEYPDVFYNMDEWHENPAGIRRFA